MDKKAELNVKMLDIVACPMCKSNLKYDKKKSALSCSKCGRKYPVKEGIPILLPDESKT